MVQEDVALYYYIKFYLKKSYKYVKIFKESIKY